jgi:hypothetical protein
MRFYYRADRRGIIVLACPGLLRYAACDACMTLQSGTLVQGTAFDRLPLPRRRRRLVRASLRGSFNDQITEVDSSARTAKQESEVLLQRPSLL